MKRSTISFAMVLLISTMLISACSGITVQIPGLNARVPVAEANSEQAAAASAPVAVSAPVTAKSAQAAAQAVQTAPGGELLAAYQQTLENVYQQVGPSVVNIRVVESQSASALDSNQLPSIPGMPFFNNPNGNQNSPNSPQSPNIPSAQALGSGFVWDQAGHIVTNNHVVSGAQKIEVTFSDGRSVPATLVGADPDSDLAVIKVNVSANQLTPVQIADSNQVKVGQMAIAIGNPFGLEGTMTVGIVSALGRTLPAGESQTNSPSYSIPDIIQTDAPINPGNSGGVLLDSNGQLIGVTAAIESTSNANAGIGFVIPSAIVKQVIPALITNGKFEHPWIGISGTTLTPDLATAMNLSSDQRGALVADVMQGSPAEKAGLQGSTKSVTIDGRDINVGGDVITAVNGAPISTMDELIAYLASSTNIGQKITFTILRNGKEITVDLTLAARPAQTPNSVTTTQPNNQAPNNQNPNNQNPNNQNPNNQAPQQNRGNAYLGIAGLTVTPDIANAMSLGLNQTGVVVIEIDPTSAAAQAGLQVGTTPYTIQGQSVMIGGDVITAIDGKAVNTIEDLRSVLQQYTTGQQITLSVLRNGNTIDLTATLGQRPNG